MDPIKEYVAHLLVSDALELHGVDMQESTKADLTRFMCNEFWSAMYCEDGKIQITERDLRDSIGRLVTESARVSKFVSKNGQPDFVSEIVSTSVHIESVVLVSNNIPMSRAVSSLADIERFCPAYVARLNKIWEEIEPTVGYLKEHGMVQERQQSPAEQIIMEFLNNAVAK